jgi:stage II sporulation protein E
MSAGERAERLKNTLALAQGEKKDPEVLRWSWAGVYMVLGFLMSSARVMTDGAPFGLALTACAGAGVNGVACLVGAALGYFVTGGVEWGVKYAAACVLAYTVSFVFQDAKLFEKRFFAPVSAAAVMAVTGFLGSFVAESGGIPAMARLCVETVMAFGGCYVFSEALGSDMPETVSAETRRGVSVMLTVACALAAVSRVCIFGDISVGRILAVLLLMSCAARGGVLPGAAVGTALGAAMDISGSGVPFYTMTYAFSAMISGIFAKNGRFASALTFIAADAAAVVCAWGAGVHASPLFETFCASVVFMLLPSRTLGELGGALNPAARGAGESGLRRYVAKHVGSLSDAYGQLYETVKRTAGTDENDADVSKVFDRAADAVCVGCKSKERCWVKEYQTTLAAMNDATAAMTARGTLETEDLPEHFRRRCEKPEAFTAAVNGELRARACRIKYRDMLEQNKLAAWGQYSDISDILGRVSKELGSINGSDPLAERRLIRYLRSMDIDADTAVFRDSGGRLRAVVEGGGLGELTGDPEYLDKLSGVLGVRLCRPREERECSGKLTVMEAEPLAVSVGIAAMKKKGEKVSGDRGTYFKTDGGVLCVILSDGMGCGAEAARESGECVEILEKFLRAGVDPAVAMKILNSVMLLKSGGDWGFVTVDMMCVNLFTGETCFYKYGAAPSYVRSGRTVKRIKGETMAAGYCTGDGAKPDVVRMRLKPGSTAVIASDGVSGDDDGWLKELLEGELSDMKELARTAVSRAGEKYGGSDDMTVLAVRVENRA